MWLIKIQRINVRGILGHEWNTCSTRSTRSRRHFGRRGRKMVGRVQAFERTRAKQCHLDPTGWPSMLMSSRRLGWSAWGLHRMKQVNILTCRGKGIIALPPNWGPTDSWWLLEEGGSIYLSMWNGYINRSPVEGPIPKSITTNWTLKVKVELEFLCFLLFIFIIHFNK